MDDMDRLTEFYDLVGIDIRPHIEWRADEGLNVVTLEADCHDKIRGYHGFCTVYSFDRNGSFIHQGAYE